VITTRYSGPVDFVDEQCGYLIDALETAVPEGTLPTAGPPSLAPYVLGEPDREQLKRTMRYLYEHRDDAREKGKRARERIASAFTWRHAAEKSVERMRALLADHEVSAPKRVPAVLDAELNANASDRA
jgi:hypothetical protein